MKSLDNIALTISFGTLDVPGNITSFSIENSISCKKYWIKDGSDRELRHIPDQTGGALSVNGILDDTQDSDDFLSDIDNDKISSVPISINSTPVFTLKDCLVKVVNITKQALDGYPMLQCKLKISFNDIEAP